MLTWTTGIRCRTRIQKPLRQLQKTAANMAGKRIQRVSRSESPRFAAHFLNLACAVCSSGPTEARRMLCSFLTCGGAEALTAPLFSPHQAKALLSKTHSSSCTVTNCHSYKCTSQLLIGHMSLNLCACCQDSSFTTF
jgi:hypothetical protein